MGIPKVWRRLGLTGPSERQTAGCLCSPLFQNFCPPTTCIIRSDHRSIQHRDCISSWASLDMRPVTLLLNLCKNLLLASQSLPWSSLPARQPERSFEKADETTSLLWPAVLQRQLPIPFKGEGRDERAGRGDVLGRVRSQAEVQAARGPGSWPHQVEMARPLLSSVDGHGQ